MADLNVMCELAVLRVGAFIAQQAYNATLALVSDSRSHETALRELERARDHLEHAEFEAYLEQQQDDWWAEESARMAAEERAAQAERVFRDTHTWQQCVVQLYPGDALARASRAIKDYIAAGWAVTYSYDCCSNPEGISEDELRADEEYSRQAMLAALSMLSDHEAELAIQGNKDRDFDGSHFVRTSLGEVRRWHAEFGHLTMSGKVPN